MSSSSNAHHRLSFFLEKIYDSNVAIEAEHSDKRNLVDYFIENFAAYCWNIDFTFRKIFYDFYRTGSYFEDLRVCEATEFDIDVCFSFNDPNYKITELYSPVSFATLNVTDCSSSYVDMPHLFDAQKFLSAKNVLQWFQSLLDSFVSTSTFSYPGLTEVITTHSGPARTVKLCWNSVWISVDLVPVIAINHNQLLKCTFENVVNFSMDTLSFCFLVPKPLKSDLLSETLTEDIDRAWRIHFPETEKNIIKDESLKKLIKLMKHLRDQENWPVCSYFIKVMVFWLVKRYCYRRNLDLGSVFILFLESMKEHFRRGWLSHIIYPDFNLLHSLSRPTLQNMERRVENILTVIKNNPRCILKFYKKCSLRSM